MFKLIGFATPPSGYGFTGAAASVQVNDYLTGGAANLFLDDEVTTKTNPLVADGTGKYEACLPNGYYNLVVTYAGGLGTVTHTRVRCWDSDNKVERNQGAATVNKGAVVYTIAAGDFSQLPGATAVATNFRCMGIVLSAAIPVGSRGFVARMSGDLCPGVGSAWTPGAIVYVSNAGVLSQAVPAGLCAVAGYALNATDLVFDPQDPSSTLTNAVQNAEVNTLINGMFDIWQRTTAAIAGIADAQYHADRWRYHKTGAQVFTSSQLTDVPTQAQSGVKFPFSWSMAVTTINAAPAAGEYSTLEQRIEGLRWRQLEGQPIAISFWIKSFKTGTFTCWLQNAAQTASCTRSFVINASNTWEKKIVYMPANAGTTFTFTNAHAATFGITIAAGSTFTQATGNDGVWVAANMYAETGQANGLDSISNVMLLTGVQVEAATAATAFESRPFPEELRRCQRYHWKTFPYATAEGTNSGVVNGAITYLTSTGGVTFRAGGNTKHPTSMRVAPTVTLYNPSAANFLWRNQGLVADSGAGTAFNISEDQTLVYNAQAAGDLAGNIFAIHATFDSEL